MNLLQKDVTFTWTGQRLECQSPIAWGITEQSNGLTAILVNAPGGILTGRQMRLLSEAVGEEGLIKNSRRMAPILLLPKDQVSAALAKVEEAGLKVASQHGSVRNIVSCPGKGFSKNSRGNTLELAQTLDQELYGMILPWDFKIGISGCPRNCSGVQCHDVGLMAEPRERFSLWLGGTESGMKPKHGVLIQKGISKDRVTAVVLRVMHEYAAGAEEHKEELGKRVRLYNVIEKVGLGRFEQAIVEVLGE